VLADAGLQERLRRETDWPAFAALARRLAAERGLTLSEEALEAARTAARRAYVERRL
jgi:ribosomal protein L16/L10AE